MPYYQEGHVWDEVLVVKQTFEGEYRALANEFDSQYILPNAQGQKYVYPGLVVAQCTTSYKYVPYNASAAYGAGSDTAIGMLDELLEVTNGDQACAPVVHGRFIEANCRIFGSARGVITNTVKGQIPLIYWV